MRIIFVGSSFFSCVFFLTFIQANFNIVIVFTIIDRYFFKKKLFNNIEIVSYFFEIPVFNMYFLKDFFCLQLIKNLKIDFFVIISCAVLLSARILKLAKYCSLNVHFSVLPRFMGSNPVVYSVYCSDIVFGLSIFLVSFNIDKGPILFCFYKSYFSKSGYLFFCLYFSFLTALYVLKCVTFYYYGICCNFIKFNNRFYFLDIITRKSIFSF